MELPRIFACAALAASFVLAGTGGSALAAGPPIEDYGKLPAAEQVKISPDGTKLAYLGFVDNKRIIAVTRIGGQMITGLNAGDQKVRQIEWLDDNHVLVLLTTWMEVAKDAGNGAYMGARGNFEEAAILNANTGKTFIVFDGVKKVSSAIFGYFGHSADGGRFYGFFGGQTLTGSGSTMADFDNRNYSPNHKHIDLYKVDLDNGDFHAVAAGDDQHHSSWAVDSAGRVVARDDYDPQAGDHHLYMGDGSVALAIKDPIGEQGLLSMGRKPGSAVVEVSDPDGGWRVMEFGSDSGAEGVDVFAGNAQGYLLHDRQGVLIGGVSAADDQKATLFDPTRQAKFDAAARAFKGERVFFVSATDDFNKIIVHTEGPGDSGTYFLVDIPGHKAEAVGWEYPTILQDAVGPVRMVQYKAADGMEMEGVLTLPPGREAKNLPVVVMPHGGPQARDYPGFDWWAQAFASRGYAVFQPNFRGSDGYGRAFRDAGFGQWGRKMQTDVSDGLAELAREGIVDPKRACIVGASYGGYVALAGVTLQHGIYRCAVADAPVSDLTTMVNLAEDASGATNATARYWHEFMGASGAGDPILKTLSPAHHAAEADAPILLTHGKQDTTVPPEQSAIMRRALNAAGKPVEFVELPGEDHYLSKAVTRTQMLEAAVAFVEKYNPPN
jgi:dipeptidyl aminopeptidase/acylaminoacyl peptidase